MTFFAHQLVGTASSTSRFAVCEFQFELEAALFYALLRNLRVQSPSFVAAATATRARFIFRRIFRVFVGLFSFFMRFVRFFAVCQLLLMKSGQSSDFQFWHNAALQMFAMFVHTEVVLEWNSFR